MITTIECDVTEYAASPPKDNVKNTFSLNNESMVISFCGKNDKVLWQSEI